MRVQKEFFLRPAAQANLSAQYPNQALSRAYATVRIGWVAPPDQGVCPAAGRCCRRISHNLEGNFLAEILAFLGAVLRMKQKINVSE
jgi:hypothetical protein